MKIEQHIHNYLNNRRIDTVYLSYLRYKKYAVYFTVVSEIVIGCSVEINEINDENDKSIAELFASIEEF